tara:strand:+ start:86440 stop:86721 length:282 start_codon:yes stop_codon:yes gene_type:complete
MGNFLSYFGWGSSSETTSHESSEQSEDDRKKSLEEKFGNASNSKSTARSQTSNTVKRSVQTSSQPKPSPVVREKSNNTVNGGFRDSLTEGVLK